MEDIIPTLVELRLVIINDFSRFIPGLFWRMIADNRATRSVYSLSLWVDGWLSIMHGYEEQMIITSYAVGIVKE